MAANPATDFDLGPLTWVKTEIDHSLNQARENLDKLAANPADRAPAKYILTHLHQATGALAMVGLGAATRFNEELEKLVAFLESEDAARLPGSVAVAKKGISALATYLDSLLGGQPDSPMRLLAPYLELNRTRGQVDANEGDLFYPDLATQLPALPASDVLDDTVLAKALALQRQQYQQGLLRVIKGADVPEALRQMHAAVVAIESLQGNTSNRPFWSAAAAFFDGLIFGGLDLTPGVKPLFAKLDQQVKQLIGGSGKVAERLFRDLLLMVGRARPVSDRITTLKQAYRLEQLIAIPDRGRQSSEDDEELMSLIREVRDLSGQQKDTWLKYTSGNRAALEPFAKQGQVLAERASRLPNRDIHAVLQRLTEVAPQLRAKAIPPSEAQSLEVATAMLFVESALENYFKLGSDFPRQAKTVTERLKSAMAGEPLAPMDAIEGGLLDEMTRRAQEKLLIFQVGQEVQVNLQNIEQALDGFFRDAQKRPDLAGLPAQFAQVQGALMIMELHEAASLNAAVMARVQQFAEGSLDGTGEAAELVADGLSALGLYITALQQGAANSRDTLTPALLRLGLVQPEPVGVDSVIRRTGTVSPLDLDVQKQKVQALYKDWTGAPQEATREKLEKAVDDLKRDAVVVSDSAVAQQSEAALQAIHGAASPQQTGVFQAIQGLAPNKPPETPTQQVVQLVDAPGAEIDKELLDIFLEEAAEVVDTIATNLATCRESPHDRDSLTTIRRGFHTLKGSGRMVGLMQLGEVAWQCEQVLNKWLKDEKPATPALLDFIELAQHSFSRWVGELQGDPSASIDATDIARRADALKSGEETAAPAAPPAPEPVSPAVVEAAAPVVVEAAPLAADEPSDFEFEPPVVHTPLPLVGAPAAAAVVAAPVTPAEEAFSFLDEFTEPAKETAPVVEPEVTPVFELDAEPVIDLEATIIARPPEVPIEAAPEPESPKAPEFSFESLDLTPAHAEPASVVEEAAAPAAEMAELDDLIPAGIAAPVETVAAEPEPEDEPEGEAEMHVGGVVLPRALFEIYVGEAEQHVAALHAEMSRIEADNLHPVGADFMRAAHTLASTSRTTGFEAIADVSHALEKWLQEAMEIPPEFNEHRLSVTRRSVDALTAMVQSIRGLAAPFPREEVIVELTELRDGLREARQTGEGTHIKIPHADVATPIEAVVLPLEPIATIVPAAPVAPIAPVEHPVETGLLPEPETPAGTFEAGKDQRKIKDDVDRDLLPIFLDEAKELVPQISEGVRAWKTSPTDHAHVADLARHLHTLKGSARMTGLMRLGELAHVLEERIAAMDGVESPPVKSFEEIEDRVDRLSLSLERLARGEDIVEAEPIEVPVSAIFEQQKDKPTALAVIAAAAQQVSQRDAPPDARESRGALLRVNAEMIDRFVNEAGELSIARSRIEGEMVNFKKALGDLTENIARMRGQLREIEMASEGQMQSTIKAKEEHGETFDPLEFDRFSRMQELTRFLAESLSDVITVHQGLQKNLDETELAIHVQARLNRELQQGLMGVRLVPLGNLADRFYRIVRQTAKELDKKANLELKGTRTELDRSVLEKITAPFEHLLRNAIAHGLEKPAARIAAGKAEIGEIAIDAVQRGNEVVLTVSDDGAGLNYPRIREKAIEAGLLAKDVELPEAQLAQFIFMSGFSTATEISQVAGRGVGMDVVRNDITSLGGRVEITSTPGRGTTFTVTLPLTLAVTQAVMLRAGERVFAVPSVMIEQVQELRVAPYEEALARGEIVWKDNHYPLRSLLPLLGEVDTATPQRQIPVLLLRSGVQRAAVRVDEIVGNREVVVKTIGPQLARLAGIAGATVLGNGQVVLILNPVQLVHRETPAPTADVPAPALRIAEPALMMDSRSGAPLVMVVDDSLTVRKITSRMLTREGYEVASAKDGVDALQQLQDMRPDCILLDVEMPRMDGFEFARNVRADDATKSIPIIMITSRTADKHRNRALELGVNEYMGKPYQEEQLIALIRRYTAESALA